MKHSKLKSKVLTRIKLALQEDSAETVKLFLASAMVICIAMLRFVYLFYLGDNDKKGDFFDYPWLSSFVYFFSTELSTLLTAYLIYFLSGFMLPAAQLPTKIISHVLGAVSMFFMFWVFIPDDIFTVTVEKIYAAIMAILAATASFFVLRGLKSVYNKHRRIIADLLDTLIVAPPNYMSEDQLRHFDDTVVWPTIKRVEDELEER